MLIQFENYLTFEVIYFWSNLGVLPFWLLLVLIPNSRITQISVNSIIIPLILASSYSYVFYQAILSEVSIFDFFTLYLSLEDLYTLFSLDSFLLLFWLHFLSLNLFLGSWVSRDGVKHNISRGLVFLPLILIYFTGPFGLVLYWLIRFFYAKKLGFHD